MFRTCKCIFTTITFYRFLNHFQSKSLIHKEMLAVLSAVTEVIKQNGGSETSTEYFAALVNMIYFFIVIIITIR